MSRSPSSINLNSQTVASKCNQWNYQPVNKIPMEMINMIPKSLMLGLSNLPKLMEMLEYYNLWSMTPCKMEPSDTNKFNCYMNKKMKTHWWLDIQWCGILASLVFFSSPFLFYFFFFFSFFQNWHPWWNSLKETPVEYFNFIFISFHQQKETTFEDATGVTAIAYMTNDKRHNGPASYGPELVPLV